MLRVDQRVKEIGERRDNDNKPAALEPIAEKERHQGTQEYLQSYGLSKVSIATIVRWMHVTGFHYKNQGKHYFVDGHEKPKTLSIDLYSHVSTFLMKFRHIIGFKSVC